MRAVKDGHVLIFHAAFFLQLGDAVGDPFRFFLAVFAEVRADHRTVFLMRDQVLAQAVVVFFDQRVDGLQDLGRGTVVVVHENGLRARELFVKIHQELHVCTAPGVDGLVGIAHDEEVFVVGLQDFHQADLQRIDVLKLVDHDVFEAFLPFLCDVRMGLENVQREDDQVVVVEAEALALLVEIAVEEDVTDFAGVFVFQLQLIKGEVDHIQVVARFGEAFADLEHVPCVAEGHVLHGKAALLVDDAEHVVDVGIVQHEETARILHGKGIFLQDAYAEAMEGVHVAGVVVAGQVVDAALHLPGGLVRKGDAEDVGRQDAHLADEVGEAGGEGPGLAGTGSGDHADVPFRGRDRLKLRQIQSF